jgi:hypothetical protein
MSPDSQHQNVVPFEQRLNYAERDIRDHSKTITEHNRELAAIITERAVNVERDIRVNERFDRIEKAINGVYKLGWWILAAFGGLLIALIANFLFKGGFSI